MLAWAESMVFFIAGLASLVLGVRMERALKNGSRTKIGALRREKTNVASLLLERERAAMAALESHGESLLQRIRMLETTHVESFELQGRTAADKLCKALEQKIKRDLDEAGIFGRIGFDEAKYVQSSLAPLIVQAYDRFRAKSARRIRYDYKELLGESLIAEADGSGHRNASTQEDGPFETLLGIGLVGGGAFALGGPIGVAIVGGATVFAGLANDKAEMSRRILESAVRVADGLFHGEGYRNPENGKLLPSATAWAVSAAHRASRAGRKRMESQLQTQQQRLRMGFSDLRLQCASGSVSESQVLDSHWLSHRLLGTDGPTEAPCGT